MINLCRSIAARGRWAAAPWISSLDQGPPVEERVVIRQVELTRDRATEAERLFVGVTDEEPLLGTPDRIDRSEDGDDAVFAVAMQPETIRTSDCRSHRRHHGFARR